MTGTITTTHETPPAQLPATLHLPASAIVTDTLVLARRSLRRLRRTPQLLAFATIQPIMLVLLFRYVFGDAVLIPGWRHNYVDYLLPGTIVQTLAFGGSASAVGIAADLSTGIVDRFRSLPMATSAVLTGRTLADTARHAFVVGIVTVVGTLIGFRFHNGFVAAVAALAVAVLFGFALSWMFVLLGMVVREPETAGVAGFLPIFPLVFTSTAFSPLSAMPDWLQVFARNQPFTHVVLAVRGLSQQGPVAEHLVPALVWSAAIVVVCATLSVRRLRRIS